MDMNTIMKPLSHPLPDITEVMIDGALGLISNYMNEIEMHYKDSEIWYANFIMGASDGDALASLLVSGLRYEELVQGGGLNYDDWRHGKWNDAR